MTIKLFSFLVALFFSPSVSLSEFFDVPTVVNVTLKIAEFHNVACIQIFHPTRMDPLTYKLHSNIYKSFASTSFKTSSIYSFDKSVELHRSGASEGNCFKPIKVVIGVLNRRGFAKLSKYCDMSSSTWLVFVDIDIEEFFRPSRLPFGTELIVATFKNKDLVVLRDVYRVDKGFPMRINYLGNWTREGGLEIPSPSLYGRRSDLEGKIIRAGSIENWPMSTFHNGDWDGYFPRVWMEMTQLINCTTPFVKSIDGSTGSQEKSGNWNGLVGMITRREIDIIVSELSANVERSYILDFTYPLFTSKYQVYFKQAGRYLEWYAVFSPFGSTVWIAIAVWILAGTLVVSINKYSALKSTLKSSKVANIPADSFFFMLQSFCQQGSTDAPKSPAGRITFLCCYIISAVMIPAYSASLVSSLTNQTPVRPFDSLREMLDDGTYKLLTGRNTAEFDIFANATDPFYQDVFKNIMNIPRHMRFNATTPYLEEIICRRPKCAVFAVQAVIDLKLETNATTCNVMHFSKPISPVSLCMGLLKNSQYTGLINHQLRKLFEVGIINRIRRQIWHKSNFNIEATWNPVELDEVFQIFAYLSFGMIVSLVVLLIENLVSMKNQWNTLNRYQLANLNKQYLAAFDFYLE